MVKKAIILSAGLGTRFLPLSKALPKEFLPLVDKPSIQYLVEEAVAAGIEEIIFVVSPGGKGVLEYFKRTPKLEKILKERKKETELKSLEEINELTKNLSFSYVVQKEPRGNAHAISLVKNLAGSEPCAIFYNDDIFDAKTPALSQLIQVFKTAQAPVITLKRLPREKLAPYGVVDVEKIANRLYKIKKFVEKPKPEEAPSDLVNVGRHIITPEVFNYYKRVKVGPRGEMLCVDALNEMLKDGKIIYGYEVDGEWLECGNKFAWLQSNLYLTLKHPEFGLKLKQYLKELT